MRRSRAGLGLLLLIAATPIGFACSGSEGVAVDSTTTLPAAIDPNSPLAFKAYSDPAVPVVVALGTRFALSAEAEPTSGRSWKVTAQPDPAIAVPIGEEFRPTGTSVLGAPETQLISYAAKSLGETDVELTYVDASGASVSDRPPLRFHIIVTFDGQTTTTQPALTTTAVVSLD